jgi:hypothetical protein
MAAEEFQDVLFVKVVIVPEEEGAGEGQEGGAGEASVPSLAQALGVDRFPLFQLFRGSAGKVAEFTANLSAEGLDRLRWALRTHRVPYTTLIQGQKGPASVLHAPGWPLLSSQSTAAA